MYMQRRSHLYLVPGVATFCMVLQLLVPGTNVIAAACTFNLPGQAQGLPWARCDRPRVNVIAVPWRQAVSTELLWNNLTNSLNLPHNNLQSYLKHPSKFLETFLKHPQNTLWSSLSTLKTSPKYSSIIIETPFKLLWNNLKNLLETPFKSIRNTIETIEDFKDTKGKKGRTKTRTHKLIEWQRLFLSSSSQLKNLS